MSKSRRRKWRRVEKILDDLDSPAPERKKKLKVWKGKKIIPLKKWYKKVTLPVVRDYSDCIPDVFSDVLFFDNPDEERDSRNKWYKIAKEYFENEQDPEYGRYQCRTCPLAELSTSFGIGNILLKFLEKNLTNFKNPCDVQNIFECPYGYPESAETIVMLGEMAAIVQESLEYACGLTKKYDKNVYVDFVSGLVGYENQPSEITNHIWERMSGLKVPLLPIRGVPDIYDALTREELLETLIDQYENGVNTDNIKKVSEYDQIFTALRIQEWKPVIVHFFEKYKELVKIEELRDCRDYDLKKEEQKKQEEAEYEKRLEIENPIEAQRMKEKKSHGICLVCNGIARVFCLNCQKWLCADHWLEHGTKTHNFVLEMPDCYRY